MSEGDTVPIGRHRETLWGPTPENIKETPYSLFRNLRRVPDLGVAPQEFPMRHPIGWGRLPGLLYNRGRSQVVWNVVAIFAD